MINWHRFKRDVPSFLDRPETPQNNYRDGIVPLNMAPRKDTIYDNFPEEKKEEITEVKLEEITTQEEIKPKKGRKPLDKNKKNP